MYLVKHQNVFVQLPKCISSNSKVYTKIDLFKYQNVFVLIQNVSGQISKCISLITEMYFSQFKSVSVPMSNLDLKMF